MRDMLRATVREGNFDAAVRSIAAHLDGALTRESGLYFATKEAAQPLAKNMPRALSRREEAFMSRIASGLPLVKQSERAYTVYLDRLRMEAFSKYADELRAAGAADPKEFRDVAHWLNLATGRGDVGDWGKDGGAILNAAFFSPRYTASRFQVLNPVMYARMAPSARRLALRKMVRYAGTIGSTLLLAKMGGAEVNLTDPSRPDWLKIKVGNTYYDPGSGLQQTMRFVYRMGLAFGRYRRGEKANSNDHAINVLGSFARTKLAPVPGAAVNVLQGRNVVGEKVTPEGEALKLIIPLMAEDLYDAYQREGFTGAAKTSPALLGVGVQTYERKNPGRAATGRTERAPAR